MRLYCHRQLTTCTSVLILWVQKSFIEEKADPTEVTVIVVGGVVTAFWVGTAYLAIRLENMWLVYVFYATSWLEPTVICVNFVRVSVHVVMFDLHCSC